MLGLALGSVLVLGLVAIGGAGLALIATGVLLSAITLAAAAHVHAADDSPESVSAAPLGELLILSQ
jgi:hypothetical protein